MREKELNHLEEFIPYLAEGATKKAYLEALSKGQSVLEVIDGAIYEIFADGTKKKIKNVEASIKVDITKKIVLSWIFQDLEYLQDQMEVAKVL